MAENSWRGQIAPGMPVALDGALYLVEQVYDGWVLLHELTGEVRRIPMGQLAKLLTDGLAVVPRPKVRRLPDVEQRNQDPVADRRMSAAQRGRVGHRLSIVRWFETGLRPEQGEGSAPDRCHDPALVPDPRARVRAMAPLVAQRRNMTREAAIKYIGRTLERATIGESGLLDRRFVAPSSRPSIVEPDNGEK